MSFSAKSPNNYNARGSYVLGFIVQTHFVHSLTVNITREEL